MAIAGLGGLLLASCAPIGGAEYDFPKTKKERDREDLFGNTTIFGSGGLSGLFGDQGTGGGSSPIPINSFLWRASLDTMSFMPLASADPFGGVIITDWFTPDESPDERFKMTIYILSRDLRSDGVKVSVFRRIRDDTGNWVDSGVTKGTARRLEAGILRRARELRVSGLAQ